MKLPKKHEKDPWALKMERKEKWERKRHYDERNHLREITFSIRKHYPTY